MTLIGATTENPYFEVNSALLSRLRVFRLEPLSDDDVGAHRRSCARATRAASAAACALGVRRPWSTSSPSAPATRGRRSTSSSRRPRMAGADEAATLRRCPCRPRLEDIETAAQQRVLAYDRAGDGHYGTVSAFIKSMRGNDPDAALYWLATMVAAGEDPKFIARRHHHRRQRGRGQRRPAWPPGRGRGRAGARLGRSARGPVRARAGHRLSRHGAQVEPLRAGVLGRPWRTCASTARCRCRSIC